MKNIALALLVILAAGSVRLPAMPLATLTVIGNWTFYDRSGDVVPAQKFLIELRSVTGVHLAWDYTDADGDFSLTSVAYPSGPVKVRIWTYTLYSNGDTLRVTDQEGAGLDGVYFWDTVAYAPPPYNPPPYLPTVFLQLGVQTVPAYTGASRNPKAWWLLNDLQRGYAFAPNPPGSFTVEWPHPGPDQCEGNYIRLTLGSADASDILLHEMGHGVMVHAYGGYWPPANCPDGHRMGKISNPVCAWTEGWASFWALAVNNDPFYHWSKDGATDMENPSWPVQGDQDEGRVAAALWDLLDAHNDGYDTYTGSFDDVWAVFTAQTDDTLAEFWEDWEAFQGSQTTPTHEGVRCLYQNTIDYNHAPVVSGLPDLTLTMNNHLENVIDLFAQAGDEESSDDRLTFTASASPSGCGVFVDAAAYVDVYPATNWAGTCSVIVTVSDTLATGRDWFQVTVVDTAPPAAPGNLRILSPQSGGWTGPNVTMAWNSAVDVGVGVDGYSFAWNTCWPDQVKGVEETVTRAATSFSTSGGRGFSVRAVDGWGNWGNPACLRVNVDADPPSSSVVPLVAVQGRNWWVVEWSGSDAHSGVAYYDLQYKEGTGGAWTNWLMGTHGTQGLFVHATPGATYSFRCRAVDRVGNASPWPGGLGAPWPADANTWTEAGFDTSGLFEMYMPVARR